MKHLLFLASLLSSVSLFAQVENDECNAATILGTAPVCESTIFSNIGATASNIGDNNLPACFSSGNTEQDVWFSFELPADLEDITIIITGSEDGANGQPIINPQMAVYRGSCDNNQLTEVACGAEVDGGTATRIDLLGLTTGLTYFIRINDGTSSNTNFAGDFSLCIKNYEPIIRMGEMENTTACSGQVFDSGGPNGNYKNNENQVLTICPSDPHECILIDVASFTIDEFDQLNFYAGADVTAPLIGRASGTDSGTGFKVQTSSDCVTLEFKSDDITTFQGFSLSWTCQTEACTGSSIETPNEISTLPFTGNFSTCDEASSFMGSPCNSADFLNGPEMVFKYESPGGFCTSVSIANAAPGTGVIVLDGDPKDASTNCIAQSQSGMINSVDMRTPGTYYIVIGNAQGCTPFDLSIVEAECRLSPALSEALCNPVNNCIENPSPEITLFLENGFKDLELKTGVNAGCWLSDGEEPDYYWFTMQAAQDGDFGFVMQSAGVPSDLDFNVWGPFTANQACDDPNSVIDFISSNQPIRSSWQNEPVPSGMARVHPVTGETISDLYDCGGTPSGQGDGFVLPIEAKAGEVYVVLINDWDNKVGMAGVDIQFSSTDPGVLTPIPTEIIQGDTAICAGSSTQIILNNYSNEIRWIENTSGLSCTDCPDPIVTPTSSGTYTAIVEKACNIDTIEVSIDLFAVDAGPDRQICGGEDFQIISGKAYTNATYQWSILESNVDDLIELSCTDCPDPLITTSTPNTTRSFTIRVNLTPEVPCNTPLTDEMVVTILPQEAASFEINEDQDLCRGSQINLGSNRNTPTQDYTWYTAAGDTIDRSPNPQITPTSGTVYYVKVENGVCPTPSLDSIRINIFEEPTLNVIGDTTVCQGDVIIGGNTTSEPGVNYQWSGPETIFNPTNPNAAIGAERTGIYQLTAVNGPCQVQEDFNVTVTPSLVEIIQGDTLRVCKGSTDTLRVNTEPAMALANWTGTDGTTVNGTNTLAIAPTQPTTYYATLTNENCVSVDSIMVIIDSLPPMVDWAIMPMDTTICEGSVVVLSSNIFEPSAFPDITFQWAPSETGNFQSPDSLYNLVVTPDTTTRYVRTLINGACVDSSFAIVNVDTIPDSRIIPDQAEICPGESVELEVEVNAPVTDIQWMPPETLTCSDCLTPTATPSQSTNYNFQAKAGECTVSATASIQLISNQYLSFPNDPRVCLGESIQLNTTVGNATYLWTSADDPTFDTLRIANPTVTPETTTTYTVVIDDGVCPPFEESITIQVLTTPEYQFPTQTTICEGESITLNSVASEMATYQWTSTDPNFEQSFESQLTISPTTSATYSLVVTNGVCPAIQDEITIDVTPQPTLPELENFSICQGETVRINTTFDPLFSYTWNASNDPNFSDINNPTPFVTPGSTSDYELTVSNECGTIQGTVNVDVADPNANINLSAQPGIEIQQGESVTLNSGLPSNPNNTFTWSNAQTGTVVGFQSTVTDTPFDTTTYLLSYVGGNNCVVDLDSITIFVIPQPDFRIPNAFTPNNDSDNDFFTVAIQGDVEIVDFKIYNRWGQIVYDNDSNEVGWDGMYNGNPAPSDVYVYVIELNGVNDGDRIQKGDVTLLR